MLLQFTSYLFNSMADLSEASSEEDSPKKGDSIMELFFLAILFVLMMYALGSGFPVAFALKGSAIVTIVLAGLSGAHLIEGDSGAYFIQDGPVEWLTAGVMNFRGIYWEVERDTLIAIPLFIFMGISCFNVPRSPKIFSDNGTTVWTHSED